MPALTGLEIERLLLIIEDIIDADGTYHDKVDQILNYISPKDKINLLEFVSWFADVE